MTLRELHMILSKIIDEECKTNPDILDKYVVISVLPCTTKKEDLRNCGFYGVAQIIHEEDCVYIANYT